MTFTISTIWRLFAHLNIGQNPAEQLYLWKTNSLIPSGFLVAINKFSLGFSDICWKEQIKIHKILHNLIEGIREWNNITVEVKKIQKSVYPN